LIFLRVILAILVGTIGAILGVEVVESTFASYSIGVITCALIMFIMEGV